MDEQFRRQIDKIMAESEAKERERTLEFFEKTRSIEPPSEEERRWLLEQFRILSKVVKLSEENNMTLALNLFTMGRAYERYYSSSG